VCPKVTEVTEEHATVVRNWTQKRPTQSACKLLKSRAGPFGLA
jgi:hypothetical protein